MIDYKEIGYKLVQEKEIPEINSKALLFDHIKTGARVLKLENKDYNNVFGIGFKTPPQDSTGVAHILEHSVLSGSRKYKTKEPFMDIYKGSLQTFLNAMTFGDKTIYPIGSRNDKDFENLMDVYLDAVFYPMINEKPEIFMQEGWHYEILDKEDPIEYKGVVYNEMKGAMSAPEDQVEEFITQSLYPDTTYSQNSGGDPYEIPKLTYEGLGDFHKKFYHPSNSYIFFYGNRDTYKDLKYLDEAYLSSFGKEETDSEIPYQEAFDKKRYENHEYSTSDDLEGLDRDYLAYSVVTGESADDKTNLITKVLVEALINSDAAPIKKALLDAKIGEDVFAFSTTYQQIPLAIVAKNTSSAHVNEFEGLIETSLRKLVDQGIDKDLLESTLNKFEYSLREASGYATKGIIYYIQAFDKWLYGQSPIEALEFDKTLKELREGIGQGIFEKFIEERILDNTHKTIISVLPNQGLNQARDQEVKEKLQAYKESLSDESLENLIEANKKLEAIQLTEDSKEAKDTIPRLALDEVKAEIKAIPRQRLDSQIANLFHDIFTGGINYVDLVFDLAHISLEDLPYASLLTDLLGSMDTGRRDYTDLANQIYINTGGIGLNINVYNDKASLDFKPKLLVSTKYLDGGSKKAVETLIEILASTKLENVKRYKDLIKEIKSRYEMTLYQNGSAVVMARSTSLVEPSARYRQYVEGIDYFNFIQDLDKDLDEGAPGQLEKLKEVYDRLLTSEGLLVNITSSEDEARAFLTDLEESLSKLKADTYQAQDLDLAGQGPSQGIMSSASVQYVSKAASMKDLGLEYKGQLAVLSQVLTRGYLHNTIRAKGGAYGAGLSIGRRTISTYSYRDPNLVETIQAYDDMGAYIRQLDISQEDLETYIIGTMGSFDPAQTARSQGSTDLSRYLTGLSKEEIEKTMEEALGTRVGDLKAYGPALSQAMEEAKLVVLGSKDKVKENEEIFETTYDIMK